MTMHAFLKLDGIKGEATEEGHEAEIMLDAFTWGGTMPSSPVGHGAGAGRVELRNVTIDKKTDASSALLFKALCTGQHFAKATLSCLKPTGTKPFDYLKYDFTELFITDLQWAGASNGVDDTPRETLGLAFGEVTVTYTTQKPNGDKGEATLATYNRKTGKSK